MNVVQAHIPLDLKRIPGRAVTWVIFGTALSVVPPTHTSTRHHAALGQPPISGDKIECGDMGRPNDREVPPIECGDPASANSLARGDDRSVDRTKRKVSVGCHQLRNSKPIGWGNLLGYELARR
jgi:hypothetical protein